MGVVDDARGGEVGAGADIGDAVEGVGEACGAEGGAVAEGVDVQTLPDETKPKRWVNVVVPVSTMLVCMVGGIAGSGLSRYYATHRCSCAKTRLECMRSHA